MRKKCDDFLYLCHFNVTDQFMRDFIRILKRFVPPYKKYMVLNIVFNVLSAILNLFLSP